MIDSAMPYEAINLVNGDRSFDYDKDEETSLPTVAALWSAYLGVPISVSDVCHMMVLIKIARSKNKYKRDNHLDAIGYVLLAEEAQRESRCGNGNR